MQDAAFYPGGGFSAEHPQQFFVFVLIHSIVLINGKGWCAVLLFVINDLAAASALMPFVVIWQVLLSGFFINLRSIPAYLCVIENASALKFAWLAAIQNQFETLDREHCGHGPLCNPEEYLNIRLTMWENVMVTVALTVAVHLVAVGAIYRLSRVLRA